MNRIYSLYDNVAGQVAGRLFTAPADAAAIRSFVDALRMEDSIPGQHPQDFDLLFLGTIDEQGVIDFDSSCPKVVLTGASWLASISEGPKNAEA